MRNTIPFKTLIVREKISITTVLQKATKGKINIKINK